LDLNPFLFILFLGELMNSAVKEILEGTIIYLKTLKGFGRELRTGYARNEEVAVVAGNIDDVFKPLEKTLIDYASFALSHLSNIKSTKVISEEEAKKALERMKVITQ